MSREKKQVEEEVKASAPAFIVTFSDMITLLLTFFVLLLTLASEFEQKISTFRMAVADMSLSGIIFSKSNRSDLEYVRAKYPTKGGEEKPKERTIDSQSEMLRNMMFKLEKMVDISPSYIVGNSKMHTIAEIDFDLGNWVLDKPSKEFLRKYFNRIQEAFGSKPITLYIVGLANSEKSPKDQWMISSRRAQEVSMYLQGMLPEDDRQWQIYSWGAGSGGDWSGIAGFVDKETEIMLTILLDS